MIEVNTHRQDGDQLTVLIKKGLSSVSVQLDYDNDMTKDNFDSFFDGLKSKLKNFLF